MMVYRYWRWLAIVLLVLLSNRMTTAAEPTGKLLVCLHFPDDPLFTKLYTRSIQRHVQEQLASCFAGLSTVEVTTKHPLIERLGDDGDVRSLQPNPGELGALGVADKAFLFSVENAEGMYQLHWRQIDGQTQQVSAAQSLPTPDRQWVAKAIGVCVRDDFAPLVIIEPDESLRKLSQVRLTFPSAEHKALVQRWLSQDTILQPFYVLRQKDGTLARMPIPHTVLRIGRNDTGNTATFHSNLADPWRPTPRIERYEALKLSVQTGYLRIRLVDAATGGPMTQCIARANTTGFASLSDTHQFTLPDRRGMVVSQAPIDKLAFVEIVQGGRPWLKLPVPITSPMCEVTLKVTLDEAAGEKSDWERRLRYLVQDVSVLQTSLNKRVRQVNQLHSEKKYEQELQQVRAALAEVTEGQESARQSQQALQQEAAQLKLAPTALFTWVNAQVDEISQQHSALAKKADDLQQMITRMDKQSQAQVMINQGDAAAANGDWDEALAHYESALRTQPEQPMLAARLARYKQVWTIKSSEHQQARDFIYQRWANAEVTELANRIDEVERAFATIEAAGDYLSARKLAKAASDHNGAMAQLIDLLLSTGGEDNLREAGKYQTLTDRVSKLAQRVAAFETAAGGQSPVAPTPAPTRRPPIVEEEEPPARRP